MTTENQTFLQAIRANPNDRTARLVYADWLDEHDDPLAEYVRAETELVACDPETHEWTVAADRLQEITARTTANFGGWEYVADFNRIREKIHRLSSLDTDRTIHGARWGTDGHEYEFRPTLNENALIHFERKHGLLLPAEYRAFILRVANGRVGPGYGLIPLDLAGDYPALRKPFAVTPAEADAIDAAVRLARETRNWRGIPRFQSAWWERGYLRLADKGCGNYSVLVVNGPMRGDIWALGHRFSPHRDRNSRSESFLEWYEKWLDQHLRPEAIERRARATGQ